MFDQINAQFSQYTKQLTESALRANAIAVEHFEALAALQVKAVEARLNAATAFASEAAEARDLEAAKALLPKTMSFVKDASEHLIAVSQEMVGQTLKTSEALAGLAKSNFDAASEVVARPAAVKPAPKKAA
ncbi:MAG: phasin family protein [Xanthomonadales bacterium]|nr:phasin family protein [Xanthomonadales bacterium]